MPCYNGIRCFFEVGVRSRENPVVQQDLMRQLLPGVCRRQRRRVGWVISDIPSPPALIVGKLAENSQS